MAIDSAKKLRGRPRADTEAVNVRMTRQVIGRLDAWIERQSDPKPTRPEAVRRLMERGLDADAT